MEAPPPIESSVETKPGLKERAAQAWTYLASPQIFFGAIFAFVVMQTVDHYKTVRKESREDTVSIRDKVTEFVKEMPPTSTGAAEVITKTENLFISYGSPEAREYLAKVIGQLSHQKAQYLRKEQAELFAAQAERVAQQASSSLAAASDSITGGSPPPGPDAERRVQAAKAAIAAAKTARARAETEAKRVSEESAAYLRQRRWDQMPSVQDAGQGVTGWPSPAAF